MRWWTEAEDGHSGAAVVPTLHHEGTTRECIRFECPIKVFWWRPKKVQLVARAYQKTGELTLALEAIRVE